MRHLLLIVTVLIWASVSAVDICSHLPGYTAHGTSCFKVYKVRKTWADAEASCVADGGHLASIHSSEEQAFLIDLVDRVLGPWIGLTGTPPTMAWSDNTDVDYENWYETEPDRKGASCIKLKRFRGYKWVDASCTSNSIPYICRTDATAAVSTTPVTTPQVTTPALTTPTLTTPSVTTTAATTTQVTTTPVTSPQVTTPALTTPTLTTPPVTTTPVTTTPVTTPQVATAVTPFVDQKRAFFTKIPGGVPADAAVVPSSTQTVGSVIGCARRCLQDAQCVHFIMTEDGGNYLCETYTTLVRPPTATPPTDNYQKIV